MVVTGMRKLSVIAIDPLGRNLQVILCLLWICHKTRPLGPSIWLHCLMNLPLLWSWSKNLQLEVGSVCLSKPVEAHDKISFANHVSCVTIAWFGHAQSQASPLGNEHSKSEPPLKGWGHSIDKTPSCNSLGWSKDGTQFGKDIQYWSGYSSKEEPYAEVPLGNHVDVGNMQLQGSSSAGQVSYLVYSGPPLQHCDFCQFWGGHGHQARECSSIHSWSSSPLKCYNCFG